jgi:hypothetical protein
VIATDSDTSADPGVQVATFQAVFTTVDAYALFAVIDHVPTLLDQIVPELFIGAIT